MKGEVRRVSEGHYSLEIRGYACPYPMLMTLRALDRLAPTEVLEVVLDNVPSVETIPAAVEDKGHKTLEVSRLDAAAWKIVIKK